MYTKTCKWCSDAFETKAHNALYCPSCRKDVKNARRRKETPKTLHEYVGESGKALLEKAAISSARISQENPCKKKGAYTTAKPFPNVSLNKIARKLLLKEIDRYLVENKPRPSASKVIETMNIVAGKVVNKDDEKVLNYYKVIKRVIIEFSVAYFDNENGRHYYLSMRGDSLVVPGSVKIPVKLFTTIGGLDIVLKFQGWAAEQHELSDYARECEIWDCEIRKARKAWQEILDSTTRVNYLPEEARPFVEKVFARQMGLEDANLNIIRRFERED